MSATILLLEDDHQLSDTVKQFLTHHGYEVLCAYDGLQAEEMVYEHHIDLMLLDVKVPYQNGFEVLKKMRQEEVETPAIFITSLNGVEDVTEGFDAGADDYIRKPFALKELLVRIEAQIKRHYGTRSERIVLSEGVSFDIKEMALIQNGQRIPLKNKELKLLALFIEQPNTLLTHEQIFERLWSYDETPSSGSLRAYIKRLRTVLGKAKIETVKNMGYRFVKE